MENQNKNSYFLGHIVLNCLFIQKKIVLFVSFYVFFKKKIENNRGNEFLDE